MTELTKTALIISKCRVATSISLLLELWCDGPMTWLDLKMLDSNRATKALHWLIGQSNRSGSQWVIVQPLVCKTLIPYSAVNPIDWLERWWHFYHVSHHATTCSQPRMHVMITILRHDMSCLLPWSASSTPLFFVSAFLTTSTRTSSDPLSFSSRFLFTDFVFTTVAAV